MSKSLLLICFSILVSCSHHEFSWDKYADRSTIPLRNTASKEEVFTQKIKAIKSDKFVVNDLSKKEKITVLVLGDTGTGGSDQYAIAKHANEVCIENNCDMAILLGDNIYPNGLSTSTKDEISEADYKQIQEKIEVPYKDLNKLNFWAISGNHDWRGNIQALINYTIESPKFRMPYNHYMIPLLPKWLNFYGLDTTRIERLRNDHPFKKEMLAKGNQEFDGDFGGEDLTSSLCGKEGWRIIFGHHGVFSSGFHGVVSSSGIKKSLSNLNPFKKKGQIKEIKESLLPLIKKCHIQLVLSGHDHHLEHIKGVDENTNDPVFDQVIIGSSAKTRKLPRHFQRNKESVSLMRKEFLGFGIITATKGDLVVDFYGYEKGAPEKFSKVYSFVLKNN